MQDNDNQLQTIKELLEIVRHKVDSSEAYQMGLRTTVALMNDQISVMNGKLDDPDYGLVAINQRLEVLEVKLNDPENGLESINDRVEAMRSSVVNIESKIDVYDEMYKRNNDNAKKLDKRLNTVEEELAINPSEELSLTKVD